MRVLITCLIVLASLALSWAQACAQEEADPEVALRTEAISKTLRCVVCQNQSIHDSNAPLAEDMRTLVRKRVEAGDSDDEVRDYLRERYGDYVLMRPPLQLNTILLWIAPFVLVGLAGTWFVFGARSTRSETAAERPQTMSAEERARVRAALSGDKTEPGA